MAADFPTSLHTFTDPTPDTHLDDGAIPHSGQHIDLNAEVAALELKVGIDGSADATSIEYRLTAVEASSTAIAIGEAVGSGTANRILFEDASNLLGESASLQWDGTSLILGSTTPFKWGATAAEPMLKPSGANLQLKLADDSNYGDLHLSDLWLRVNASTIAFGTGADVILGRGGVGVFEIANATPAQSLYLYGTSDAPAGGTHTNYSRVELLATSSAASLTATKGGTGTIPTLSFGFGTKAQLLANDASEHAALQAAGRMYFEIDTDNDSTTDFFRWQTNSTTIGAGTELMKLTEAGVLTLNAEELTPEKYIGLAVGDETTAITTGTAKLTFRIPLACTLKAVRASLTTASSSGIPTIDINESGTTILSTKLTIDATETTSTTAATAAVISDSALADDAEITIDIDVAGTGAAGLKVWLIVVPT